MTVLSPGVVRDGIASSWRFLAEAAIGEGFANPHHIAPSPTFRDISFSDVPYARIYLQGLQEKLYNIITRDFSYFQFGCTANNEVRYAYYPNPFMGSEARTGSLATYSEAAGPDDDIEEIYRHICELDETTHPPLLRYENSEGQYRELEHPCSHLHVGHHHENRWAFARRLTPLAFTLFVTKQYYPDTWASKGHDLTSSHGNNKYEQMLAKERIRCGLLGPTHFSALESQTFHLT